MRTASGSVRVSTVADLRRTPMRVVSVVFSLALLAPAAAHAERVVTNDAVGDAEAWTYEQDLQLVPAPQEATADITRTVAALGNRQLRVTIHFRDLEARPRHDMVLRIRTPHTTFDVIAERRLASQPTAELTNPEDDPFACRHLDVGYDGRADVVSVSVPTRCIGSPLWVRVGVKASATPAADSNPQTAVVSYFDDALRDGGTGRTVRLGERIRRG